MTSDHRLHLQDLSITGFRGLPSLVLPKLGRVTLITGRNGAGKTTVLEAIQAYASRGRTSVLNSILTSHQEFALVTDEDGDDTTEADWGALFHRFPGRPVPNIRIGPVDDPNPLQIALTPITEELAEELEQYFPDATTTPTHAVAVTFRRATQFVPWYYDEDSVAIRRALRTLPSSRRQRLSDTRLPLGIKYERIGPGVWSSDRIARLLDHVSLTETAEQVLGSLSLILGEEVEGVAAVDQGVRYRSGQRRVITKLKSYEDRLPLQSLGDGATRLFSVALALVNSKDGFLLIDEAENGIHYTVQKGYWDLVFRLADEHNVQVVATTHSLDCVLGFSEAAEENRKVEGVVIRLDKVDGNTRSTTYSEERLSRAATQDVELR